MSVNLTRYALWFGGSSLVVLTFMLLLQQAFNVQLGSAFVPILPAIVAAMVEGSKYAKETREKIERPWRDAAGMTGVAIVLTATLVFLTTLSNMGMGAEGLRVLTLLMLVYGIFWLITNRIFLAMGMRNEWANQDRKNG